MFKRIHSNEGGFTLVELLVTISILAVLFGIVALSLRGVGSSAKTQVNAAELGVVQSAVDIYMADQNLGTLPEEHVRDTAAKITSTDTDAPFNTYLRHLPTKCEYSWDENGVVQIDTSTCPIPTP